jgi:hypothetical protein|tara:strand:+ start:502 stop:873 length:372 start_codon:yes stop_codon:yes gene_type:complete
LSYQLLTFLFLLFAKHAICDLAIQRLFPSNKEKYFNRQAHTHYFHHGLGSLFAGLVIDIKFAFVIFVLDYVIHWHVDYCKTLVRKHYDLKDKDLQFWVLQSVDQILHYLTYILFAVLVLQFYA